MPRNKNITCNKWLWAYILFFFRSLWFLCAGRAGGKIIENICCLRNKIVQFIKEYNCSQYLQLTVLTHQMNLRARKQYMTALCVTFMKICKWFISFAMAPVMRWDRNWYWMRLRLVLVLEGWHETQAEILSYDGWYWQKYLPWRLTEISITSDAFHYHPFFFIVMGGCKDTSDRKKG